MYDLHWLQVTQHCGSMLTGGVVKNFMHYKCKKNLPVSPSIVDKMKWWNNLTPCALIVLFAVCFYTCIIVSECAYSFEWVHPFIYSQTESFISSSICTTFYPVSWAPSLWKWSRLRYTDSSYPLWSWWSCPVLWLLCFSGSTVDVGCVLWQTGGTTGYIGHRNTTFNQLRVCVMLENSVGFN